MEPKVQAHDDGTLTISITLPAASDQMSMLAQEERLMAAINAVGRVGAAHFAGGFRCPRPAALPSRAQVDFQGQGG